MRLRPRQVPDTWRDALAHRIATAPVNLVSARDRARVRRAHVDECVAVGERLVVSASASWLDLGTGGGLPGLVLAALYPSASWTLLDARAKKLRLVARFAAELGLDNVTVLHGRAEHLVDEPAYAGAFCGVISRAVAPLDRAVALSRGFVRDGQIIAIRGPEARAEAQRLVRLREDLDIDVVAVEQISGSMRPTWLIRARGRGPAPDHFPQMRQQLLRTARGGPQ